MGGVVEQRSGQSADTSVMSQQGGIFPDAPGGPEHSGDGGEIRGTRMRHLNVGLSTHTQKKRQLVQRDHRGQRTGSVLEPNAGTGTGPLPPPLRNAYLTTTGGIFRQRLKFKPNSKDKQHENSK